MSAMAIEDVSDDPTPTVATAPVVEPIVEPIVEDVSEKAAPTSTGLAKTQVPPLKHMCFKLCDQLIKKALL